MKTMSPKNPTEEIRTLRRELNLRCDGDLDRIIDELRTLQAASGRVFVNLADETASSTLPPPLADSEKTSSASPEQTRTTTAG